MGLLPLIVRDGNKVSLPCPKCSFWRFTGSNGAAEQELINQMSIGGKVTSDRLSVNTDCSLVIPKVTVEDAGQYTCTVPENTGRHPGLVNYIDLSVVVSEYLQFQYLRVQIAVRVHYSAIDMLEYLSVPS